MRTEEEIAAVMAREDLRDEQKEMAAGYIERREEDSTINAEWETATLEIYPEV